MPTGMRTSTSPIASEPSRAPLDGILVVSVEQAVAAPFATRQLADQGARVIKVERPDGGDFARRYDSAVNGLASHFVWLNRGKESLTANLKDLEDRALIESLLAEADVFVQNLRPGAAERLELGAAQVHARHPRIVACEVSGYGSGGPYGGRKAYDLLIQAEAGLIAVTGSPEHPARAGVPIADLAAGTYAFSAILTALFARERTGRGEVVEVSLLDALADWMGYPALYGHYRGEDLPRTEAAHASIAPYGPFPTRTGPDVYLAVQNESEWGALCERVLGRPEMVDDVRFATNEARVRHRTIVDGEVATAFAAHGAEELLDKLQGVGIACAVVRGARELVDHPQLVARDRWQPVGSPGGEVLALMPPFAVGEDRVPGPVPALGEHDAPIRDWVRRLRAQRI